MTRPRSSGRPLRRPSKAAARLELLAFVEGLRTEEIYLTYWRRLHRERVLVTIDPFRGGPLQLVQRAIEVKRRGEREARKGLGRAHDQVWCVFDRDEHPNVPEALSLAEQHGIGVAFSNPCLELWFVLHFADQTAHVERGVVQKQAKELLGCSKVLDQRAMQSLAHRYEQAKARAIRLNEKHAGDGSSPGSNPSSTMWRLVDVIRSASPP